MSLNYQIQPSNLVPNGVTVPYGRYNVVVGDSVTATLTTSINAIADALRDGKTVIFVDSLGANVGHLMPTLTGGFVLSESPVPLAEQVMLGFRPYKELLKKVRYDVSFNRVDSTYRTPIITSVSSWYENELNNGFVCNGGHSALIVIEGSNLKMMSTIFHANLLAGIVLMSNITNESNVLSWSDNKITYLEKRSIATPPDTATLSLYVGDRMVELEIPLVDKT